jgi:GntR family phosphonate transport system transcriptional regulator
MPTPLWKSIAATLKADIAAGHYQPGQKLPTEAALALRFGVNRHTVRHAIADMAERGIVRSRRGAGVFVQAAPTDYPIGRRVRFSQNIRAAGRLPNRQILRLEPRPCDASEAHLLGIEAGAMVLAYEGLSLAGATVMAHFVSLFPTARVPGMAQALGENPSITQALAQLGIGDYLRLSTRITAEKASAAQAALLALREGDVLLRSVAVNATPDGVPLELGTTWFAGERVALVVGPD